MNKKTILPTSDDLDEAPVWTDDDFKHAVHRIGLKPLPQKKQKINITLDPDIVAWFKQQAGGRGYQTLINAALREAMQKKTIEETIRKVIKEELHSS
ncbi:BrnA antitoxin family protein [Nitrosomonas sp.]|uniref:BrnA antitoxin family protein n=1 Tax=Nitrosomonas sp. TaxID=42353 RepID=UPI001E173BC9|nr:BrnA antitoxin family protein [Nitrosomonas sp.]MBX3617028.1 BrnA antitoxin family protein [Nitrosomonas sp.]